MSVEMKVKILVGLLLWLPVFWLVWNQVCQVRIAKKRIRILDRGDEILCEYNKVISNPIIDDQSKEAITLRHKARRLWSVYLKTDIEYDELLEQM